MIKTVQIPLVEELDKAAAYVLEQQGISFREDLSRDYNTALGELDVLLSDGYSIVTSTQFKGKYRLALLLVLHKHESEIPF